MSSTLCERVRQWIWRSIESQNGVVPPADLVRHIAACPSCLGATAVLLAELLNVPVRVPEIDCNRCDEDLAAYVDMEMDAGTLAAIHAYPHVWWSIWACPDCSDTYTLLRTMLQADADLDAAHFVHPSAPRVSSPTLIQISLDPQFLDDAFASPETEVGHIRSDAHIEGCVVSVQMQASTSGAPNILVLTTPALPGWITLTRGTFSIYTRIDHYGQAVIPGHTAASLATVSAPNLSVRIEPDRDPEAF